MELAEKEATEFLNWNVSMKQKDHKDWFRGTHITRKYINTYTALWAKMFILFPGFKFEVLLIHCFSKKSYTSLSILTLKWPSSVRQERGWEGLVYFKLNEKSQSG